ncbi:hypothetical protein B0T26DRAFT_749700 [Lasiosphaeria miniovina]|uniref:Aminoglycoside phosphotransferase domain-containing protein n=1 Tax=Lasiosphaeria miniovina TaxID=1954250 RepID=A0AA40AUP9_9PEZI|nr:uncharacterized protein B0T26DRAFT_749700 [Lasiosphaeria miniovina]KAK0722279.1 hypothetical protein B0T26DRAFT_749700 [Lasiosphaeria miniovina]
MERLKNEAESLRYVRSHTDIPVPAVYSDFEDDGAYYLITSSEHNDYVFCHNDLSQPNVVVDPETLKITAILDWEYAGFFPARFESPFYTRLGPSSAIDGEVDNAAELVDFLKSKSKIAA